MSSTTIDVIISAPTVDPPSAQCHTIVLQPTGILDHSMSAGFQKTLEDALNEAQDGVIVDLLWVESTDEQGIAALVAGVEYAAILGKAISFQSMDIQTQKALEIELNLERERRFGPRRSHFEAGLEQFLERLTQ